MRVLRLPGIAELGDGALLALGDEDRVVPEALAASRLVRDASGEDAAAANDRALGRDRDKLRHVPCLAAGDTRELPEQLGDRRCAFLGVAGGVEPGTPAERRDLEARILAEDPAAGAFVCKGRLDQRVFVVRRPALVGPIVGVERLDRPARQQLLELARLVRVARREDRGYSVQRTSRTPS